MTGRQAYGIWAPAGARWVDWARPVPFVAMGAPYSPGPAAEAPLPAADYIKAETDTAVVVDLPGAGGVFEGVALAGRGFRPIPLYNGTSGQEGGMAIVENREIEDALLWGARELQRRDIPPNAPPAFLLDSNRTHRYRMNASIFDNSWDIYDQDMPSAEYVLACGIRRVVVRGEGIQRDLARILYKYQKKGISILLADGYGQPRGRRLHKPLHK